MVTATYREAMIEFARNAGEERKDQAWVLTPWDTWQRNHHYDGPPQRHPDAIEQEELAREYGMQPREEGKEIGDDWEIPF